MPFLVAWHIRTFFRFVCFFSLHGWFERPIIYPFTSFYTLVISWIYIMSPRLVVAVVASRGGVSLCKLCGMVHRGLSVWLVEWTWLGIAGWLMNMVSRFRVEFPTFVGCASMFFLSFDSDELSGCFFQGLPHQVWISEISFRLYVVLAWLIWNLGFVPGWEDKISICVSQETGSTVWSTRYATSQLLPSPTFYMEHTGNDSPQSD
jgi:hypothetical protein